MAATHGGNTGERTDIHDAAAARRDHPPARFLTHAKSTVNEVSPGLFHVVQRDFFGLTEDPFPRHIPQKVDSAELTIQLSEDGSDRIG